MNNKKPDYKKMLLGLVENGTVADSIFEVTRDITESPSDDQSRHRECFPPSSGKKPKS